jgi:glyoxylase-like metal-dependent hydrolase (beta-lactamase superfamily II)
MTLVLILFHIQLFWGTSYDIDPLKVIDEKFDLLERALNESWILFFGHDPFYEAATVRRDEKDIVPDRFYCPLTCKLLFMVGGEEN